jgi:dihydroflavonol-4-reductase
MKCLVTGATGFLGSNIVHELVKAGWDVRASGMHGSETQYIKDLPIELVMADITNAEEVDKLVQGCDIVFNVAADTSFWRHLFERQRRINVDGAINVAEACIRHGVKRLVHTSTLDLLGHDPSKRAITEATGSFNFDNMGYNYGETKLEAEKRLQAYNDKGLEVVFIYPGFMCGPYDYTLQLGRVFFDLKAGKIPGSPPGGSSFCHVTEVAKGHIAAATKGRPGEAYLCTGHNLSYQEWFGLMAKAVDAKQPKHTLPRWAFVLYGQVCEWISELTRKAPDMNPGQARYLSSYQYMDCSKAQLELGYKVTSKDKMIRDALDWYRSNGFQI